MKLISVFVNGELWRQIQYHTKAQAKRNLQGFKKHGISDPLTGLIVGNTTFELI